MSFGGKKSQSTTDVRLNGININQSSYGNAVGLLYGANRVPMTLLDYLDFTATPHSANQSGGKGGGGGSSNPTYTYTASLVMGLCEGPIRGVGQVWQDKTVINTVAATGWTVMLGAGAQATWSYLTTNFPSHAVPYDHQALICIANLQLGSSAAIPNITVEGFGFFSLSGTAISFTGGLGVNAVSASLSALSTGLVADGVWNIMFSDFESRACTIAGAAVSWTTGLTLACTSAGTIGGLDAEPSAILEDYCNEANHGCNFPYLGTIQGAGNTYQSYCLANGLLISPWEVTQRAAVDFIKETLQITNSNGFMSAGILNIVPYADQTVSGNGRTYTPDLTPLYSFTDDDFMLGSSAGSDPVICTRLPLANTYNTVNVEFLDRAIAYNTNIGPATDAQDIALNGPRVMATISLHSITTMAVAQQVARLILQRQLYIRNTFVFNVRADYCLLEPMDLIEITDSVLGLANKLVRIVEVDDDENDQITITAEDMLIGTASAPLYNWQQTQGYVNNYGVTPPAVGTPLIFTAPPALVSANGGYEMWVAVDQEAAGSWGGCDVYMSLDDVSYIFAGTVNGAARYGTLSANLANSTDPDTTDTLAVQLTNPTSTVLQLLSGSAADYQNLRTLLYVDGEFIAYQTAELTGAGSYNLNTLRRGLYGSVGNAHLSAAQFARIDAGIFRVPYDPGMIGQTMYFKFASFNLYQQSHQSLADCEAYPHVLAANNAGQLIPGALVLTGVGVATVGSSAFKSAQTNAWDASCYSEQSYTRCSAACYVSSDT